MDKLEIIAQLKTEYPALTKQVNYEVIELDQDEYEKTIDAWADVQLAKLAEAAESETKATQRQAILDRLGLTSEEARLLLG